MADTSLKFGPEWLRALTEPQQGTVNYTPPLPNMKLADYRYGREEMLALFDKDVKPSEDMIALGALFIEKCRFPLNLIQIGDEETRAWQRGANSDASLRPFPSQNKRPPSPVRGRGRGRGISAYPHYDRNRTNEEDSSRFDREERSFSQGRGRGFDRQTSEKGWNEVNDKSVKEDDKDMMVRKGYTRAPSDDWRGSKVNNGNKPRDDGWRTQNSRAWPSGQPTQSWRSKPEGFNSSDRWKKDTDKQAGSYRTERKKNEHLPEWATQEQGEDSSGCFDDSGKFKPEHLTGNTNGGEVKWGDGDKWDNEEVDPDGDLPAKPTEVDAGARLPKEISATVTVSEPAAVTSKADDMDTLADNLVTSIIEEGPSNSEVPKKPVIREGPPGLKDISWTYLDPQGQIQGPFKSDEMLEWCTAGYFPHDLMVRRDIDHKFTPLADLSKIYGRNPFTPGGTPQSIKSDNLEDQLQQQQLLQFHQIYLQQQQMLAAQQQQMLLLQQQQQQQPKLLFQNPVIPPSSATLPDIVRPDYLNDFDNSPLRSLIGSLNKPSNDAFLSKPNPEFESNVITSHPSSSSSQNVKVNEPNLPMDIHAQSAIREESPKVEFDPIQSLLQQLHSKSRSVESDVPLPETSGHDRNNEHHPLLNQNQYSPVHQTVESSVQYLPSERISPQHHLLQQQMMQEQQLQMQKEQQLLHQRQQDQLMNQRNEPKARRSSPLEIASEQDAVLQMYANASPISDDIVDNDAKMSDFKVPKVNEKKEKRSKRAEEKRKAREMKQSSGQSTPYIPGMPGSVQPAEQVRILPPEEEFVSNMPDEIMELSDVPNIKEDESNRRKLESLAKPAPWAKKAAPAPRDNGLSLQEIQKLEAEKERVEKAAREYAELEYREDCRRRDEEERQKRVKQANWNIAQSSNVKSLAEIQAEEARVERTQEKKRVKESSKGSGRQGGGVSWAGKIAAFTPVTAQPSGPSESVNVVAPNGFWEPLQPAPQQAAPVQQSKAKETPNTKKKKKQNNNLEKNDRNEFDDWCGKALARLSSQVDVPTFLGFLKDVESPFEVHDYVKSYIGDGKAEKKFATEYLEKRSRWKNSKKTGVKYEDDLTTPALALTPSEGEFQEAGRKGKKKGAKSTSKSNMNHLLGFSVQGKGVNRGELDLSH